MAAGDGQSGAEIVPERDFELGAGLEETQEGVSTIATDIAARAAADLSPGDVAADVVLRSVGVQRDLGSVEDHQQLGLVGVEPHEQTVEGDEAGHAREDAIEPRAQRSLSPLGRMAAVGLEIGIELPDQIAHGGLGSAVLGGEGVELVNQTLGMNLILSSR